MIALPRHAFPTNTTTARTTPRTIRQVLMHALGQAALWAERRRQRRALLGLSDSMLKDIGLTRADAYGEGSKPFWRD